MNRETTGLLLTVAYAGVAAALRDRRMGAIAAVCGAVWLLVLGGVRLAVGSGEAVNRWTVAYIWERNMEVLPLSILYVAILLGAWWVFAGRGVWRARGFVAALLPVLILNLGMVAVFGIWQETRLLLVAMPVVFALALDRELR